MLIVIIILLLLIAIIGVLNLGIQSGSFYVVFLGLVLLLRAR